MKKAILLIPVLMVLTTVNANAAFSDVPDDHPYKDGIDYVQVQGIVNGYSDGTFRPENPISRAEFTKIIIRATIDKAEIDKISSSLNQSACPMCLGFKVSEIYKDVNSMSKWAVYVQVAKNKNIISGYSDGNFRPDNNITIAEASKIIAKAFKLVDENIQIDPLNKFGVYIDALLAKGVLPEPIVSTDSYLKRGELAMIVYILKNYANDQTNSSSCDNNCQKDKQIKDNVYSLAGAMGLEIFEKNTGLCKTIIRDQEYFICKSNVVCNYDMVNLNYLIGDYLGNIPVSPYYINDTVSTGYRMILSGNNSVKVCGKLSNNENFCVIR